VELVDGDEALLAAVADRLTAAGARPSPSPSKLARVLGDRLAGLDGARPDAAAPAPATGKKAGRKAAGKAREVRAAVPTAGEVVLAAVRGQVEALQAADLLLRTDHPDGVHDLRVACRRLRSILAAFRPVLDRERTEPLRAELKWIGGELSSARDGEVALGHLRDLAAAQPPELLLGPVVARLQQAQIKDAAAGRKSVDRTLDGQRYLALLDDLHALLADPPFAAGAAEPAEPVLRDAVRRTGRRLRQRIAAVREGSGAGLHDIRKAAKRVRYTAEVAVPVLGDPAGQLTEAMKAAQEALGDRQDTVVTREQCRQLGLAAFAAGENAWTYGRLEGLEEARGDRAEAEFWTSWPQVRAIVKKAGRR
jgi:CHAD domain-containing protein